MKYSDGTNAEHEKETLTIMEANKINKALNAIGFVPVAIPGDGICQWNAVWQMMKYYNMTSSSCADFIKKTIRFYLQYVKDLSKKQDGDAAYVIDSNHDPVLLKKITQDSYSSEVI